VGKWQLRKQQKQASRALAEGVTSSTVTETLGLTDNLNSKKPSLPRVHYFHSRSRLFVSYILAKMLRSLILLSLIILVTHCLGANGSSSAVRILNVILVGNPSFLPPIETTIFRDAFETTVDQICKQPPDQKTIIHVRGQHTKTHALAGFKLPSLAPVADSYNSIEIAVEAPKYNDCFGVEDGFLLIRHLEREILNSLTSLPFFRHLEDCIVGDRNAYELVESSTIKADHLFQEFILVGISYPLAPRALQRYSHWMFVGWNDAYEGMSQLDNVTVHHQQVRMAHPTTKDLGISHQNYLVLVTGLQGTFASFLEHQEDWEEIQIISRWLENYLCNHMTDLEDETTQCLSISPSRFLEE
jgi:hypothetical protein